MGKRKEASNSESGDDMPVRERVEFVLVRILFCQFASLDFRTQRGEGRASMKKHAHHSHAPPAPCAHTEKSILGWDNKQPHTQ